MKKLIISTAFILFASSNTFSQTNSSEVTQELYDLGIIDSSGKYINTELAAEYFTQATEMLSKSLPVKVNKNIEIYSALMTPYYSNYAYKLDFDLNQSQKNIVVQELLSEDSIKEMCDDMFNQQIFWANDHHMNLRYMDKNYKTIVELSLNTKTCKTDVPSTLKSKNISL